MVVVAGHRVLLLLLAGVSLLAAMAAAAEPSKPTILTPVAQTPVGTFEGEAPSADAMDDDDAAPVGAPIGTTMTEPKPEPTGGEAAAGAEGDAAASSAAVSSSSLAMELLATFGAAVAVAF